MLAADAPSPGPPRAGAPADLAPRPSAAEEGAAAHEQAVLLDQTHDAVLVWRLGEPGEPGPITYWNRGAERLFGRARGEALGKRADALLRTRPADPGLALADVDRALRERGTWQGRLVHQTPDGERVVESRRVLVRAHDAGPDGRGTAVGGEAGGPSRVLETSRDVTAKVAAERARAATEARYRALVEASTAVVWRADGDGAFVDDNPSWGRFTGQHATGQPATGQPATGPLADRDTDPYSGSYGGWGWLRAVHPDDRARVERAWRDAVATGATFESEYRLCRHDGVYRTTTARAVPVAGVGGQGREWMGANVDVTDERAVAAQREKLYRRTQLLYEITAELAGTRTAAQVADVVIGRALPALGANSGVLALLRGDRDAPDAQVELVREYHFTRHVTSEWRVFPVAAQTPIGEAIRTGATVSLASFEAITAEYPIVAEALDELQSRALCVKPLLPDPEDPTRVLGALSFSFPRPHVLTDGEKALVEALAGQCALALDRVRLFEAERAARADAEAARRRAEEANRTKSQFLANMSHELRTPLNAIGGHVQLVELGIHGPVTAAQAESLGRVQRAQRHLLALINDVLDFSKVEAGRVEYDLRPVPLREVLSDAGLLVEPQLAARRHTYTVELPDPSLVALVDREKLRQVLVNLLANAVKFTAPGGRIGLSAGTRADAPGAVFVRVSDTGIGIAPDQLDAVFDPFVQVQAGLTRSHEGSGLGLAIAREFARGMGGDLEASSVVGEGSVFTVTLRKAEG